MTTAELSASLVKELREQTGAGMMDCKRALQETNGDMEAAIVLLREKGMAGVAKRARRQTTEGLLRYPLPGRRSDGGAGPVARRDPARSANKPRPSRPERALLT